MWYFELNGTQQGPESTEQLQQRLKNGELSGTTLVWREGMADWTPLSQVKEFQGAQTVTASGSTPSQHAQGTPRAPGMGMPPTQNSLALTSMILGICSLVLLVLCMGILVAIPAVVMGHIARKQIREAAPMQTGDGMALAGLITGYLGIALTIIPGVMMVIVAISEGAAGP